MASPFELMVGVVLLFSGHFIHEGVHYVVGRISGGQPFIGETLWGIPYLIDFKSPQSMTNRQVQLAGGLVSIFPFIAGFGLYVHSLPIFFFGLGGGALSWLDLLATKNPEKWKQYTAGHFIRRDDRELPEEHRKALMAELGGVPITSEEE